MMFWSYRRHYDTPVLVLPLTGLLVAALTRGSAARWAAYGLFGLTLWAPLRIGLWASPVVQGADLVVWVAGAVLLVWWADAGRPAAGRPADPAGVSADLAGLGAGP
jgi:hypothetical protein